MRNEIQPFFVGIGGQTRQIKLRIWLREAELRRMSDPVPGPTFIPSFDQNPAETVFAGEINIVTRVFGSGAKAVGTILPRLARVPGIFPQVHAPPDAHILARLNPR